MQDEVKTQDTLSTEFDDKGRGILKSTYDFLSSLIAGSIGFVTFIVCARTIFRHEGWLADISIIEWALLFWVLYCFHKAKELAVDQVRSVFLFRWRLFASTGWIILWTAIGYKTWFKWGSDLGFQESFFASNLFEFSLLFVVALGSGLGILMSVVFDEDGNIVKEKVQENKE